MGRYSLRTLGALGLQEHSEIGAPSIVLGMGKATALLAYLALTPNRSVLRDECVDLFWSNLEVTRARLSLRQVLYQLRGVLGAESIQSDGRRLALRLDLPVDLVAFRAAAEAERPDALDLFTGRFLESVSFPGGSAFEQWADRERSRAEGLLLHTAESLVQSALREGRTADAIRYARRVRDLLDRQQKAWKLLLDTCLAAGDRTLALAEAEALGRWLHDAEESLDPSVAASIKRMERTRERAPVSGDAFEADLVGREHEFSELLKGYHAMVGGRSRHLHVSAPAGLGKTRLLTEVAARFRLMRGRVAIISAVPSDSWLPFSLLARLTEVLGSLPGAAGLSPASAAILLRLVPALSSRFAVVASSGAADDELTRTQMARELLESVAAERALVVMVDDLHWADGESLAALRRIADRLPPNVLLLTASRPPVEVRATSTSATCSLAPLTVEQVQSLLLGVGLVTAGAGENSIAMLLTRAAGGSPLLVIQLLLQGLEEGWLLQDGEQIAATSADAVAAALEQADPIGRRLRDLPPNERAVLQVIAVAGLPLEAEVIADAIPGDVRSSLQSLANRGLVTTDASGWICVHDLVGERALQDLPSVERRALHAALGRALAAGATGLRATQVAARHLEQADDEPAMLDLAARFVAQRRADGARESALHLARQALGEEATRRIGKRLMQQRPWRERVSRRLVAATLVLLVGSATAAAVHGASRNESVLVVTQQPLAATSLLSDNSAGGNRRVTLRPALIVEARGRRTNTLLSFTDTVRLLVSHARTGRVDTTVRVMTRGRVEFDDFVLSSQLPAQATLVATTTGERLAVPLPTNSVGDGSLRFLSFVVGSVALSESRRTLRVPPNTSVHGIVRVEYTTFGVDETIVYAATPTWGKSHEVGYSIGTLSTPTLRRRRDDAIDFVTPSTPGAYYMILVAGPEASAPFLLSQTNWVLGTPVWHDGNDIADWPAATIERAMREGRADSRLLRLNHGTRMLQPERPHATAFRVIVDPKVSRPSVE